MIDINDGPLPTAGQNATVSGVRQGASPSLNGHGRVCRDGKFLSRGGRRFRIKGVTYGPFAPDAHGVQFGSPRTVAADLSQMTAAGINALRTYHVPPAWLLELVDERQLGVLVDVPWSKHLCFLGDARAECEARAAVRDAVRQGRAHSAVLAYSVGNEIPADIVRWHGCRRVERFIAELRDVAKQVDPECLVTYANYPPTEYLDLSMLDFVTFNVYLHDHETFRRYLFRIQNLVGDVPLVLGELGMDTHRHGELEQERLLSGHVSEALRMGLAGVFVFSWTDEWHTGGYHVEDWAFGITQADRFPKASYHALRELFEKSPVDLLTNAPRVSVVVCSYNGAATLEECLQSLERVEYPNYEVIVVDDGSTDNTREILGRFPAVRAIHQANSGLSTARNVGLQAATGAIVAYTDSDCFVDGDWLSQLVDQLERSGAAAVGGPNLSPDDGRIAACVAASPGQPTHVLESDQVAEHIPGCNMAFRREALEAIGGFDAQFRTAGDDVDVCWRLHQAGSWITFAPAAFVWHHRRQNVRTYLRQQAGYGEAESLLQFKHPEKFTARGDGKWRGVLYGSSLQGLRLSAPMIYRGDFGAGLFQCLYEPQPAHWAMLPGTLEWHLCIVPVAILACFSPLWWMMAGAMWALSIAVALLHAAQAKIPQRHASLRSRLLIAALCYLQPLCRSFARYRTRLFFERIAPGNPPQLAEHSAHVPATQFAAAWWSENGGDRVVWLQQVMQRLAERRWGRSVVTPWAEADMEVYCHPWTALRISTAQEEHGSGRRLLRIRCRLRPTRFSKLMMGIALATCAGISRLNPLLAPVGLGLTAAMSATIWWRGRKLAQDIVAVFDELASELGMVPWASLTDTSAAPAAGSVANDQSGSPIQGPCYEFQPVVMSCRTDLD